MKAKWLEQASQCYDREVMSLKPGQVELGVRRTSVCCTWSSYIWPVYLGETAAHLDFVGLKWIAVGYVIHSHSVL